MLKQGCCQVREIKIHSLFKEKESLTLQIIQQKQVDDLWIAERLIINEAEIYKS